MTSVGAVDTPLTLSITSDEDDLDLTEVTAVELRVRRPNLPSSEYVVWDVSVLSTTSTAMVIRHTFVEGDLPKAGSYSVRAFLTTPGGERRTKSTSFQVSN